MNGSIIVFTKEPVDAIDYICFKLKNGEDVSTDHETAYFDTGYIEKRKRKVECHCVILKDCSLNLGDIPFSNQIARIDGIKELQSYDETMNKECLNKVKVLGITFNNGISELALPESALKYVDNV